MIRRRTAELMDDPAVDHASHVQALRALIRVNRWLGVDRSLARGVHRVAGDGDVSVLDLGTGGGGFLAYLAQSDRRSPVPHDLSSIIRRRLLRIGLDRSEFALSCAEAWHPDALRGLVGDARKIPLGDDSIDIVTCSLFLHHFDAPDAIKILSEAARVARRGIVIGDLSRSRLAWIVTWLATRLLSSSRLFHVDGPRSVAAAYRANELSDLAREAGLSSARVERRFPFRLILTWRKSPASKAVST